MSFYNILALPRCVLHKSIHDKKNRCSLFLCDYLFSQLRKLRCVWKIHSDAKHLLSLHVFSELSGCSWKWSRTRWGTKALTLSVKWRFAHVHGWGQPNCKTGEIKFDITWKSLTANIGLLHCKINILHGRIAMIKLPHLAGKKTRTKTLLKFLLIKTSVHIYRSLFEQ